MAEQIGGNRRHFLRNLGAGSFLIGGQPAQGHQAEDSGRAGRAAQIRVAAANGERAEGVADQPTNGDEQRYSSHFANFSKGLPHDDAGIVNPEAYAQLLQATAKGRWEDFEKIPMGGRLKLVNPMAAFAYGLEGPDSHQTGMPAAPAFSGAEQAGEMVELYWQALTRDVPFARYDSDAMTVQAAADLSKLSDFRGPKEQRTVTAGTLFRGSAPGCAEGPYVSQFLWLDIPGGQARTPQKAQTAQAGQDFLTDFGQWLPGQNGTPPGENPPLGPIAHYVRTARDLTSYVRSDFPFQSALNAALILLGFGAKALNPSNPYVGSQTQTGFVTFGQSFVLDLVTHVSNEALKAAWFHKWVLHRRLRPEEFGGRVHADAVGLHTFPIHSDLNHSAVLPLIKRSFGSYLLPSAYPEGCPAHPSYPAGHAVIAGSCVTALKAIFDETYPIPTPVTVNEDGSALDDYAGNPLTVGGELHKLAFNMAIARNAAGLHWRSDAGAGVRLGEAVAIGILRDIADTLPEPFDGFRFTQLDGTPVRVTGWPD